MKTTNNMDNLPGECWAAYDKEIKKIPKRALRKEVNRYFNNRTMSLGDLAKRLYRWYSPEAAEMIATTETTRVAVQRELNTIRQISAETGTEFLPIWTTANDELVCPICEPRNAQVITDNFFPPAHPRCRCLVNHCVKWLYEEERAS